MKIEQYRQNPIANMQPCWKYVQINDIEQQLQHIEQEIAEVRSAIELRHKTLECWDVVQGGVTLLGIMQQKYNQDIHEINRIGIAKNIARPGGSYYKAEREGVIR